jgi:predicted DNA-binding protein
MVSRSVRMPVETYERVRAAAKARGLGVTTLMR